MTIDEISRVCYVGAGTMGCYNALVAAISGYDVVLYDVQADTLRQVAQRQQEMAAMLVGGGYCSADDIPAALERVTVTGDLGQATAGADLVSESVFERLAVKRDIHRQLDVVCAPDTILTTNSSALPVSAIEDAVTRGERFAALHSHLGAPLVDIVAGPRTDPAVIDILQRYVYSVGGVPLVLRKEHPGYVLNAMLGPVLGAALALLVTGVAGVEAIDRAWMRERRAAMGPFGMMDLFGLNLILDSWQYREVDQGGGALRQQVLDLLRPLVERGELGMKSGKGFYGYPDPAYQQPGFVEAALDPGPIYQPLMVALVANAVLIAARDVAAPADIDRAWTVGTFLDTGPFAILEQTGHAMFLQLLATEVSGGRFDSERAGQVEAWLQRSARDG